MKTLKDATTDIKASILARLAQLRKEEDELNNQLMLPDGYEKKIVWDHRPVSPIEFINGREFINDKANRIWPHVREDMEIVFSGYGSDGRLDYSPAVNNFFNVSGLGCLAGYTEIKMVDGGTKKIEDIVENKKEYIGKQIISYDEETDEFVRNKIVDAVYSGTKRMYCLHSEKGDIIHATANHPFFTKDSGWKRLDKLTIEDEIKLVDGFAKVVAIIDMGYDDDVYDLTMEAPYHSFIANNFVVHNSGKSVSCSLFVAYLTYWLHCMSNPYDYYDMYKTGNVPLMMCLAPTEQKARKIVYQKAYATIAAIDWFRDNNYAPDPRHKNQLIFYKSGFDVTKAAKRELTNLTPYLNIRFGSGKAQAVVGEDLYACVVDEACSPGGFELRNGVDRCEEIYETVDTRRISRFGEAGLNMFISSAGTEDRWLEKKVQSIEEWRVLNGITDKNSITEGMESGHRFYHRRRASFDCNPTYKDSPRFNYRVEKTTKKGAKIVHDLKIPLEFKSAMESDPEKFLRDICAIPTMAAQPYFTAWQRVLQNVNYDRVDPLPDNGEDNVMPVFTKEDGTIGAWDLLPPDFVGKEGMLYYCFPKNTPVIMSNFQRKDIQEIVCGDEVITHTGSKKKVLDTFSRHYKGEFVKIKTQGGHEFAPTNDHKILVLRKNKCMCGNSFHYPGCKHEKVKCEFREEVPDYSPEWIEAGDISKGDFLVIPKYNSDFIRNIDGFDLCPELAKLCGWFMAEGSYGKAKIKSGVKYYTLAFTLHEDEIEVAYDLYRCARLLEPSAEIWMKPHPSKKALAVRIKKVPRLIRFMRDHIGEYSHRKFISKDLMSASKDFHFEFLKSYLNGDGHYSHVVYDGGQHGHHTYGSTTSIKMCDAIRMLLVKYGFVPSEMKKTSKYVKNDGTNSDSYRIGIHGHKQHADMFGGNYDHNMNERLYGFNVGDYCYLPVREIERYYDECEVYDIEVQDDHSFIVSGGFVVHNCHIDLGTGGTRSSGRDACGVSLSHRGPDIIRADIAYPTVVVDLSIRFKASKRKLKTEGGISQRTVDEIDISDVREFIIKLDRERGFNFAKITYDGFNSLETLQTLQKLGYEAERAACNKDTWDNCRSLWYDGKIDIFEDEWLLYEMSKLEDKGDYVDHGVGGHDDEAQAMARAVEMAIEGFKPDIKPDRGRPRLSPAVVRVPGGTPRNSMPRPGRRQTGLPFYYR